MKEMYEDRRYDDGQRTKDRGHRQQIAVKDEDQGNRQQATRHEGTSASGLEDRPDLFVELLFGMMDADKYQEGTLIVNLVASSNKKRVWRP